MFLPALNRQMWWGGLRCETLRAAQLSAEQWERDIIEENSRKGAT